MTTPSSGRSGILIVRCWIEGNAQDGFRARITHMLDSADTGQETATAAAPADIYSVVRDWVGRVRRDEFRQVA